MLASFAQRNRIELASHSSIPLYYQLSRVLQRFIQEQGLKPGDRFPSEEAITEHFGVSRPTVNKAAQQLVAQGWLVRERGRGTFVADKSLVELTLLSDGLSLAEQFGDQARLQTKGIAAKHVPATSQLSVSLHVPLEEPVLFLRRLRLVDNRPIIVCDSYVQATRFPGLAEHPFVRESLYATFEERYDVPVMYSSRTAEAVEIVEQEVAALLEVPLFSPVLLLRGTTFTKGHVPIEYLTSYVREGVAFRSTVRRPLAQQAAVEGARRGS